MDKNPQGQIITFYSYKGGTGRTMALANIACVLAQRQLDARGRGVLMIDWDLEAPGLHRFFARAGATKSGIDRLEDPQDMKPGLIDLFYELDKKVDNYKEPTNLDGRSGDSEKPASDSEKLAYSVLRDLEVRQYIGVTRRKGLSLLKAGRFNPKDPDEYPERVNKFNWEGLYRKCPHLFRVFGEMLAKEYAYVLIDSRTGVTDISGISTMLLPEKLVIVFTPNTQSVKGGLEFIRRATDYRKESADLRPLLVFPLVSRVEANEPDLRHDWRFGNSEQGTSGYQPEFEKLLAEVYQRREVGLTWYFDEMQIQHIPHYAYGEEIAVLVEKTGDKFSLRRSYDTFANKLVESRVPWEGEIGQETGSSGGPASLPKVKSWFDSLGSTAARKEARVALGSLICLIALFASIFSVLQSRAAERSRASLDQEQQKNAVLQNQLAELQRPLQVIQEKDKTIDQLYSQLAQASKDLDSSRQETLKAKAQASAAQAAAERLKQQLQRCCPEQP